LTVPDPKWPHGASDSAFRYEKKKGIKGTKQKDWKGTGERELEGRKKEK